MAAVAGPIPYTSESSIMPGMDAKVIASSDTTNNDIIYRGLWVGGAGDVSLVTAAGNTVVFKAVPAGTLLPVCNLRINMTGTTASSMVGIA